jgi:hypothetical protein
MAAGALFQNWPQAFCKNLDQRILYERSEVTDSIERMYGSLYRWLAQHADPAYDVLRSTVEHHYLSTRVLHRQTRIFGRRACSIKWTSLGVLNAECGLPVDSRNLLPFLRALGIATPGRRRGILRIPRSKVAELIRLRDDSLPIVRGQLQWPCFPQQLLFGGPESCAYCFQGLCLLLSSTTKSCDNSSRGITWNYFLPDAGSCRGTHFPDSTTQMPESIYTQRCLNSLLPKSARSSVSICSRAPNGRYFQRQYQRKAARCQRTRVSGISIIVARLIETGPPPFSNSLIEESSTM